MPNVSDPLQDLRDVHLPDPISWWPPAFGWWMILVLIIIAVSVLLWAKAYYRRTRPRRFALAQLKSVKQQYAQDLDDQWAIREVSHLLRRYALSVFSRSDVAGLSGKAWLKFLDDTGRTNQFSEGPGQSLQSGPYQAQVSTSASELLPLVEQWIQQVRIDKGKLVS